MGQLVKKGPPSALPQRDKLKRCMISTGWLLPKARRNLGHSDGMLQEPKTGLMETYASRALWLKQM